MNAQKIQFDMNFASMYLTLSKYLIPHIKKKKKKILSRAPCGFVEFDVTVMCKPGL